MIVDAIFQKMELATTPEKVNYENGQQIPLDTVKVAPTNRQPLASPELTIIG
jgi:hypothetical protein